MRHILIIVFLTIYYNLLGQDIKPISPNFKSLQSPSFSYFLTDSSVWIYKGALYGWTELADARHYVPYTGAEKNVDLNKHTLKASSIILLKDSLPQFTQEGQMYWDSITQSIVVQGKDLDTHLNVGEELWVPICLNTSGAIIANGTPVYISGSNNGYPTIMIATNETYIESRLIGVATEDIPINGYGRVTRFGYVNDLDLSACTPGSNVYLGKGQLTHIRPSGGDFPVVIGKAMVCTTSGKLLVYPQSVEYTAEINQAYGWPSYLQGEQTVLSFTNASRTLTISPVSSSFYFYQAGIKYIKTGAQSFQISNVEGVHLVYYDSGVLYEVVNGSRDQYLNIIRNMVTVSAIYWDADNQIAIYNSNERHTFYWPSWVHAYAHLSFSTQYGGVGLGLTNITLGTGTSNADAQFGADAGTIMDEDIISTTDVVSSTSGLPIYYRTGANGLWRRVTRSGYSFLNDGTTGLAMYNLYSGGTWSIVSMTNNYYRLVHVFATNDIGLNKTIVMSGVSQYPSASDAEAAVSKEIANIYNSNLPFAEVKHIGSLILHTKTGLGNSVNSRYVAIPSKPIGENFYMDFRRSSIVPTAASGGASSSTFLSLPDTPPSYAGHANKLLGVDNAETGVEFKDITKTSSGVNIPSGQTYNINNSSIIVDAINDGVTTTASSQNALYDALALKAPISGSTSYIQNQNSSAQIANAWINGSFRLGNDLFFEGNGISLRSNSGYTEMAFNYSGKAVPFNFYNGSGVSVAQISNSGDATFKTINVNGYYSESDPSTSYSPLFRVGGGGAISTWFGSKGYNYNWIQSIQDDGSNSVKPLVIQPLGGETRFYDYINILKGGGSKILMGNSKNTISLNSVEVGEDAEFVLSTQYTNERFRVTQTGQVKISNLSSVETGVVAATSDGILSKLANSSGVLKNDGNGNLSFSETISQQIRDGVTTSSPSEDVIYDAISYLSSEKLINSYTNRLSVTTSSITVNFPTNMSNNNYFLYLKAYYPEVVNGRNIQMENATYNFSKTISGFSVSLDTIAGYLEYFAADSTNVFDAIVPNLVTQNDSTVLFTTPYQLKNYLTKTGDASQLTNFPTLNQNTTGTAGNVTGVVAGANGGTGVNNSGKTITLSGNLTTNGPYALGVTLTGTTGITLPVSGTLLANIQEDSSPDLGGNLNTNNYNINVTSTLTNQSYSGIIESGIVGENVVFGDVLYLKFSDGKWWKAKADAYTTTPAMRMALATISANGAGLMMIQGNIRYDSWSFGANKVYLSATTAGAITTTQPSTTGNQIQVLGTAKTSTTMYFKPSQDVGEK